MRASLTSLALLLLVPVAAGAQPARTGAPARIEFRAFTEDGQTVADLKAGDVALKVNGKPRTIQSLSLFHATEEAAAGSSSLPPPYATNVIGAHGRVLYVLVDDDSISAGREAQIKEAVRLLAQELSPADRLGVLNTQGTMNMSPSSDITKARMAVDAFTGKAGATETDDDSKCRTKKVLAAVGTMLSLTGGTPATIVIFSSGLSTPETKKVVLGSRGASGTSDLCPVEPDDFANIGRVSAVSSADLYLFHVIDGLAARTSVLDAGFESLAGVTGAEFIRMPSNPQTAVSRLLRETAAYYVATFEPDPGERNGQGARIEMKPVRDKVRLRTRPSVLIPKEAVSKTASPKDMLRTAVEYGDLPLRATAYASRLAGSNDIRVMALFEPVTAGTLTAASVGIFDAKGTLKGQWTAQKDDLAKSPMRADLQAPPGAYRVRVAAVDATGRGGTTDYELKADTVRADPLTLSTLVIGTQQQGAGFVPRLEFTSEAVAIGLLEIYGVPKDGNVTVTLDVVSTPEGQPLASAETQLGRGSSDDARTAVGGFGIGDLAPGDYLMRAVVLLDGKPVGRVTRTLRKAR